MKTNVEKTGNIYLLMDAENEEEVREIIAQILGDKYREYSTHESLYFLMEKGEKQCISESLIPYLRMDIPIIRETIKYIAERYIQIVLMENGDGSTTVKETYDGPTHSGRYRQSITDTRGYRLYSEDIDSTCISYYPTSEKEFLDDDFSAYLKFGYSAKWEIPDYENITGDLGGRHKKRMLEIIGKFQKRTDEILGQDVVKFYANRNECSTKIIKMETCNEADL